MSTITVYTTGPACQACNNTKRWLNKYGIPFTEIDVTKSPEAAAAIKALGFTEAPAVIASNGVTGMYEQWSNFRPDLLAKYCTEVAA